MTDVPATLNFSSMAPGCDLISANLSMSINSGGNFQIQTAGSGWTIGNVISVFGISCIVTEAGPGTQNKPVYNMSGVWGNVPALDKQLLLVVGNVPGIKGLIPLASPTANQQYLNWSTLSACAEVIGSTCGVPVTWATVDSPLLDVFLQTGMNCGDAIKSLASRVGAFTTFDGLNNIVVFTPTNGYGGWSGVSCDNVTSTGITETNILNMTGVVNLPVAAQNQGTVTDLATPSPPPVELLTSFTNVFAPDAPNKYVPIPGDFQASYIRFSVTDAALVGLAGTESANGVDPATAIFADPVIPSTALDAGFTYGVNTQIDPGQPPPPIEQPWVAYPFPVVISAYGSANTGANYGVGLPYLVVQASDFPTVLQGKQFRMDIGYTRSVKPIQDSFNLNLDNIVAMQKLYVQAQQENIRYYCSTRWQVGFKFSGSLPIPGNNVSFNIYDTNVVGIVETVNVTYNGSGLPDVTLSIGQYTALPLNNPISTLDYYLATGTTAPG